MESSSAGSGTTAKEEKDEKEGYGENTRKKEETYGGGSLWVGELKEEYVEEVDENEVKQEMYNEEEVATLARVEEPPDLLARLVQEMGGVASFEAVVEQEGAPVQEDTLNSLTPSCF